MSKSNKMFYCTCLIEHNHSAGNGRKEKRHLKFHRTEVDEEECCVHCGYYAWEMPQHRLFPRTIEGAVNEVAYKNSTLWNNIPERKYYYGKNYYSDYEVDNGDAFNFDELVKNNDLQEELSQLYVKWGGSNREKNI